MGYAKGKNDIAGIVSVAMFGCLYVTSDKKQEDGEENNKMGRRSSEPSAPLVFLWVSFSVQLEHSFILQPAPSLLLSIL